MFLSWCYWMRESDSYVTFCRITLSENDYDVFLSVVGMIRERRE